MSKVIDLYTQYLNEDAKRREFSSLSSYHQLDEVSSKKLLSYSNKAYGSAEKFEDKAKTHYDKSERRYEAASIASKIPVIGKAISKKLVSMGDDQLAKSDKADEKSMSRKGLATKALRTVNQRNKKVDSQRLSKYLPK